MGCQLPERKMVASLIEQPQTMAVEIRIDRVELLERSLVDVEDMALWVQVVDLPCLEMLPYQRFNQGAGSSDTLDSSEYREPSLTNQSIKLSKKVGLLVLSETDVKNDPNVVAEDQLRKLRDKRKTVFRKEQIKKFAKPQDSELTKDKQKVSDEEIERKKSGSRTLSFKISEPTKSDSRDVDAVEESQAESSKDARYNSKENFKDSGSFKKIKLLRKLLAGEPEDDVPAGVAFNSDCCVLVPFTSVSDALYKMERMPLIIYVVQMNHSCSKLIGKVRFPFDFSFQQAVIKAAKLRGGVVTHAVQETLPVYMPQNEDTRRFKVGNLYGSVKIICYGGFGMTEVKGPQGDLMTGRFHEWKAEFRDLSNGLGWGDIDLEEQPYGFSPDVNRSNAILDRGKPCPSAAPIESMFDYIQFFSAAAQYQLKSAF